MSSISPNAPPRSSAPPDERALSASIERLRAEQEAAETTATQSLLLHEIGVLEERFGDEAAAARDHLAAVNGDPEFREPLERLVAIIERRQSYKNLGKVLERLARIADTPAEQARALTGQAAFLADQQSDLDGARLSLLDAVEQTPDDPSIWLALELVAARLGDGALSERAIAARAELIQNATLRGLLLIDVAERRAEQGNVDSAFDALDRAIAQGGEATFLALLAQERLAAAHELHDAHARALETQGELALRAVSDGRVGDAHGIPQHRRSLAFVGDCWLRAADIQRGRADLTRAAALLDRAIQEVRNEPLLVHARLEIAEAAGDHEATARLAALELEQGIEGEAGAALWLCIARAADANGDRARALEAVEKALALAPRSVTARALELEWRASGDPARFATAIESLTEQLEHEPAKANAYLLAADTWARLAADVSGAKAALSQASMFGAPPQLVARVARMLAALVGETAWYEEATRRLLSQGATEDEQVDLWLELLRARALRGETAGALSCVPSISSARGGAWLGNALGAYLGPWLEAPDREDGANATLSRKALEALAELETDRQFSRALRTVVALRALLQGDLEAAVHELSDLHGDDAADLVVAGALSVLLQSRGEIGRAREVLWDSALAVEDTELASAFALASGMLSFQLGDRKRAVDAFQRGAEHQPEAGGNVLAWALRASEPNDLSARSKAIESLADTDPALAQLERFTLEVGRGGSQDTAWDSLVALQTSDDADLSRAGELGAALWGRSADAVRTRQEALDALASRGPAAARLARAVAHQLELSTTAAGAAPDATATLESAQRFAEADSSAAPALEWLAAALAAGERAAEVKARRALAARLAEPASHAVAAGAALVAALTETGPHAPVAGEHPAVKLANLELAPPGIDPGHRARALLEARPSLGDECIPVATAMAGFNQLAAGDVEGALASFRSVVEAFPNEVIGWEGLRGAALASGDRATLAEASAALGDAVGDGSVGARLWEEAATILLDELGDQVRGEFALSRAAERDIQRFSAFDRLFRIVRGRKDGPRLLELISRRLEVASEPEEVVRLIWERARALREAGDREGALAALEKVRELEPNHVGALALTGEICITLQRFEEAAHNLARLAVHPDAPGQQRLMSGVAAVDLYENRLKDVPAALEVLNSIYRAGLSTLPVRERLARTAARAEAWEQATEVLEQLMAERDTSAGRIEAARLAMAIYRDEIKMPEAAEEAASRLLQEAPADGEALDLVLSGAFSESLSKRLLENGLSFLISALQRDPVNREQVDRVARIAGSLGKLPLRQAALSVLVALGSEPRAIDAELASLDERVARVPRIAIDDSAFPQLFDPADQGAIPALMRAIASTISEALGPGLQALGVGKRERVDPRAGLALRNEVAAWAGALGVGEFELYVGGNDPLGVCAVASETPAIVVGKDVSAPLSPYHRQAVARELLALRRGYTVIRHREPEDVHALVVAACRVAEVELPCPPFALLAEFQRQIGREMPRKVRKVLPELARAVASSGEDPMVWYRAATSSLDRMAAVAAGDVSWVLAADARQRGRLSTSLEGQLRARRLLAFVLSPIYLELRDKLGMGVR